MNSKRHKPILQAEGGSGLKLEAGAGCGPIWTHIPGEVPLRIIITNHKSQIKIKTQKQHDAAHAGWLVQFACCVCVCVRVCVCVCHTLTARAYTALAHTDTQIKLSCKLAAPTPTTNNPRCY